MTAALWIIAICGAIRTALIAVQVTMIRRDTKGRDNAYAEFVKSLKWSDRQFVRRMLREFEEHEDDGR